MRDLIVALREVSDWRSLGENLRVEPEKLKAIEQELEEMEQKKRATIRAWFEGQQVACWEEILRALQSTAKESKIANELADKLHLN